MSRRRPSTLSERNLFRPRRCLCRSYFPIWFAPVLYFGYRWFGKDNGYVDLSIADFQTGSRVDEEDEEEKGPKNALQKFWAW